MRNVIVSGILGFIVASLFFLSQKEKVIFVDRPVEKIVEKIVDRPVEVEKIIYKKRSCKITDDQKQKMCFDLMAQNSSEIDLEKEQVIVEAPLEYGQLVEPEMNIELKNRITAHVGYGKSGFKTSFDGQRLNIDSQKDVFFGAQYQRKFSKRWSGSLMIQTQDAYNVGIGYDF